MSNDACDKSTFQNVIDTSMASVYQCGLRSRQDWFTDAWKTKDLFSSLGLINQNIIGYDSGSGDPFGWFSTPWNPQLSATTVAAFAGDHHLLGRNFPFTCLPGSPGKQPVCIDNYLGGTYVKKSGQCPPGHRIGTKECKRLGKWNNIKNQPAWMLANPPGCSFSSPPGGTPSFKVGPITTAKGTCSATEICLCREPDHVSFVYPSEFPCQKDHMATWGDCQGLGAPEPAGGSWLSSTPGWCYDSELSEPEAPKEVGYIWNSYYAPTLHSPRFIVDLVDPPFPGRCGFDSVACTPPGQRGSEPVDLRTPWGEAPNCPRTASQEISITAGNKPASMMKCFKCFKREYGGNLMNAGERKGMWPEDVEALYPFRDK